MKNKNHVITRNNIEQEVQKLVRSDVVIPNKLSNCITGREGKETRNELINLSTYLLINFKKAAFTLAETLITLGIIGIVAAMTIPTLMSKYQEKTYKTQYKKIYSELNQAMKSLEGDEMLPVQVCNSYDNDCLRNLFANKIKFLHKCKASAPNDCQAKSIFLDGNPNNGGVWVNAGWPSFVTLSGYSIKFRFHLNDCMSTDEIYKNGELKTCGWVQVDTNGLSGPNTVGKDIFFLAVMSNGFIPFYQEENNKAQDCYHGTGISCSALYINENSGMIFNSAMGG